MKHPRRSALGGSRKSSTFEIIPKNRSYRAIGPLLIIRVILLAKDNEQRRTQNSQVHNHSHATMLVQRPPRNFVASARKMRHFRQTIGMFLAQYVDSVLDNYERNL